MAFKPEPSLVPLTPGPAASPARPGTAPTPTATPRKPPLWLTVALAGAMVAGMVLDWQASGTVTTVSAQAGGPIVTAAARTAGLLARVAVEEGASVTAGDVVATLEDVDARAAVLEAEAEVAGAAAALAGSRTAAALQGAEDRADLSRAEADANQARATLQAAEALAAQASQAYTRARDLEAKHMVARQELDAARVAVVTARAGVDGARARLTAATAELAHAHAAGAREAVKRHDVTALAAGLQRAHAHLALARLRLGALTIKAPLGGVVVRRLANPGEAVTSGQAVLAIVDPARIWLTGYVEEAQAPRLRAGQAARVRFDALPGKRFAGRIAFVSAATGDGASYAPPNALPLTGARVPQRVPVRVLLESPDPALRPGMSAEAWIDAAP